MEKMQFNKKKKPPTYPIFFSHVTRSKAFFFFFWPKRNIADSLSRLMQPEVCKRGRNETENYVYFCAVKAIPKAMIGREIGEEPEKDELLGEIRECITTGNWENCSDSIFKTMRNEFSVLGKMLLRGTRIVNPKSLRERIVDIPHEGHQGIVKTKERLKYTVWWPGMDKGMGRYISDVVWNFGYPLFSGFDPRAFSARQTLNPPYVYKVNY